MLPLSLGLAELLGPVIGGGLYEWVGYAWAFTVVSGVIGGGRVLFLICGGVFQKKEEQSSSQDSA